MEEKVFGLVCFYLLYACIIEGLSPRARNCIKHEFSDKIGILSSTSIVDMVPSAGSDAAATLQKNNEKVTNRNSCFKNRKPLRQQLFASPFISTLYERILPPLWSAGLRIGGPEEEYSSAVSYLEGDSDTDVVLDLSCGTGFVGRRMATSGNFEQVFALDYSTQMLSECVASIKRENESNAPIVIIRGDAGLLPFNDDSFDAIHWGAAMHCVPDAKAAMKEVYRVLKPDGKLYATTFLRPFPDIVFRFFTIDDINEIAKYAGFGEYNVEGRGVYGILRARK